MLEINRSTGIAILPVESENSVHCRASIEVISIWAFPLLGRITNQGKRPDVVCGSRTKLDSFEWNGQAIVSVKTAAGDDVSR
ncbi:MAG: hypothetical protein ACI87E_002946 [Mariniblastus sp.]|jgi:hypothetical protein